MIFHRPVCCEKEMRAHKNGVHLLSGGITRTQELWAADEWRCNNCGYLMIIGFGGRAHTTGSKVAEQIPLIPEELRRVTQDVNLARREPHDPVCVTCQRNMDPFKKDLMIDWASWGAYKIYMVTQWVCPSCDWKVIVDFHDQVTDHLYEHFRTILAVASKSGLNCYPYEKTDWDKVKEYEL